MKIPDDISRRDLLAGMGTAFAGLTFSGIAAASDATPGIMYGYAAMTWGKDEKQAIEDIAAAGFAGVQFRADAVSEFQPAELKERLAAHKLTFVALSSGDVTLDEEPASQIAKHTANARFVRDAGGLYLQVLDVLKRYPRKSTLDDCRNLGKLLTELGKRTADIGVPLGYHNHVNTIGESPEHVDAILESSDPKFVKLELDTAHSVAGGGDPAKAIEKYRDRLLFVHLKDVVDSPMTDNAKYPFTWVELGRGRVDLPAVFTALKKVNYRGWAVVELDRVPVKSRTPKESAMISREYLETKIGVRF
jgi:inosose dehydratase